MKTYEREHNNKAIGDLGERLARSFLESNGHQILDTNFWRKYGELDIVTKKAELVHFIEVKTVSHETKRDLENSVLRGTWLPEDRVDNRKLQRIHRTIEAWIALNNFTGEWQIDVLTVRFSQRETFATVKVIENIIF